MSGHKKRKHLDFELNLIPFIDLLSTCICFLLITAVWIQVGTMNVKQSVGGQASSETAKKATLWINLSGSGDIQIEAKDSRLPAKLSKVRIAGLSGKPNVAQMETALSAMRTTDPSLATALIQPQANSVYEDIIELMDHVKKTGIVSLGVTPL